MSEQLKIKNLIVKKIEAKLDMIHEIDKYLWRNCLEDPEIMNDMLDKTIHEICKKNKITPHECKQVSREIKNKYQFYTLNPYF